MKRSLCILLAAAMAVPLGLTAGCSSGGSSAAESKGEVNVCSWGEYIDESLITEFEQQTGITVNYTTFESNETLYSLLKTGGSSYDVIVPSDYMISRLVQEGMLEELDYSKIPNFSLVDSQYKNLNYDPDNKYTVPYAWGTLGIIYNTKMVTKPVTSWDIMFDPDYAGQILMIDNPRDAFAIALMDLGYSVNTESETEIRTAYDLLREQKPIVQAYVMDQVFDKLESGEAAIGVYYAGDYLTMHETNPDLAFVIPSEGSNWFVDAMCIPKGAANKDNAEAWINFMCSTEAAEANMDYIGYATANSEAAEAYKKDMDADSAAVMFPAADVLKRCEMYLNLSDSTLSLYDELWVDLKS